MATGRKQRPYQTTWGEVIGGLYKCVDGRWRITGGAKDIKFTEADERLAVQKFREATAKAKPVVTLNIDSRPADNLDSPTLAATLSSEIAPDGSVNFTQRIDEVKLWTYVREQLIQKPEYVARMTGIPELVGIRRMAIPSAPIKLAKILEVYEAENPSTAKAKKQALSVFHRLVKSANAATLDDLSGAAFLTFRAQIEKEVPGAQTRVYYYSAIKTILAFGLKIGLDQTQIRCVLERAKVLWTREKIPAPQPTPISPEDFHKLLTYAGDGPWKAWLLCGLNLCLHISEVCSLQWKDFDLAKGTYAAIRGKTEADRIPRAAVLFGETVAALHFTKRKGQSPWVFTSKTGTRYSSNSQCSNFKEFVEAASLPGITFDSLRDGAYGAAVLGAPDERWARVLAGHRSPGLQDSYVLRNPELARPACIAVAKVYNLTA